MAVDVGWLQSFNSLARINIDETSKEDNTVLSVHTEQAGVVGLVHRLHGLGMTIVKLQIVSDRGETIEI